MAYEFIYSKKKMLLEGYRRTVGNGIKGDNKFFFFVLKWWQYTYHLVSAHMLPLWNLGMKPQPTNPTIGRYLSA